MTARDAPCVQALDWFHVVRMAASCRNLPGLASLLAREVCECAPARRNWTGVAHQRARARQPRPKLKWSGCTCATGRRCGRLKMLAAGDARPAVGDRWEAKPMPKVTQAITHAPASCDQLTSPGLPFGQSQALPTRLVCMRSNLADGSVKATTTAEGEHTRQPAGHARVALRVSSSRMQAGFQA